MLLTAHKLPEKYEDADQQGIIIFAEVKPEAVKVLLACHKQFLLCSFPEEMFKALTESDLKDAEVTEGGTSLRLGAKLFSPAQILEAAHGEPVPSEVIVKAYQDTMSKVFN